MGTVVSEIVTQAFREGNYTAVGEATTAEELAEAVPRLRNLLSSLFGTDLGEQLRDWFVPTELETKVPIRSPLSPIGATVTAKSYQHPPSNSRLIVKITEVATLYFPAQPNDGARMAYVDAGSTAIVTLDGNGRKIQNALAITAASAAEFTGRKWLYRADLADWIRIDEVLISTSQVPLPEEFDDLLVTGLAIRLAPRFGVKADDVTVARFTDMLDRLKKRYKQSERMPSTEEPLQTFSEI